MPITGRWFDGDDPTDERDLAFLEAVRAAAAAWDLDDLHPEDTSTLGEEVGRRVEVRVPLITTDRRLLRVVYGLDPAGRAELESEWTPFAYAFEGGGYDRPDPETDLFVVGTDATPEQCGRWAAGWFERQLRRRVVRREWDRPRGGLSTLVPGPVTGPAYVEWTLDDPEQRLDVRGALRWSWLSARRPSRDVQERPARPVP